MRPSLRQPAREQDAEDLCGWSVERVLDQVPHSPDVLPAREVIETVLTRRDRFEDAVIARLGGAIPGPTESARAAHLGWLTCFAGEWRSRGALPALLVQLDAPWLWADEEALHAITRIGAPAIAPLLFVIYDRDASVRRRVRAARCLCSVGLAACEHGGLSGWDGDPELQLAEVKAALRLLLERHAVEPGPLVQAAAKALCELQCAEAAPKIRAHFEAGILRDEAGFTREIAERKLRGGLMDLELGRWRTSMVSWML